MAKIVTDKNGKSYSTAQPPKTTTVKSGTTGVSVGEIKGSVQPVKPPSATIVKKSANSSPTKPVTTAAPLKSAARPTIDHKVDVGKVTYEQPEGFDTQGGLIDAKTGSYNTNYVPKSLEEINDVADPYTRNYLAANYYKSKGLDWKTDGLAKNQDEANELFINDQKEEMSALDKEIAYAKDKMKKQLKGSTGAVTNQFAQSREGMVSEGNAQVATETKDSMSAEVEQQFGALEQRKRQLEKLQQQQQTEYSETRATQIANEQKAIADAEAALAETQSKQSDQALSLIKTLSDTGALAGLDDVGIKSLQKQLVGMPEGVVQLLANAATSKQMSESSKAKWDTMNTALNTFKGLASEGIQITPQMMLETAQQTGMPIESLMAFNQKAQSIMQDKSLDQATKLAELQKTGLELDRSARGVVNSELEKVDYLENLYKSGASQDEIARAKRVMGIKDEDDPMYRLDLEKKQLDNQMQSILNKYIEPEKMQELTKGSLDITGKEFDNIIKEAEANGASETEILNLRKLQIETKLKDQELLEKVGTEVITSPGKYKMEVDGSTGGLKINAKAGAWGGQCGHFVNDVFGERIVGDSFESKMALTDPNIKDPTPGMAFVMPVSGKAAPYGHIGIVLKDNGNGTVNIVDSNWDNKEHIQYRTIPKSKIAGYIPPPLGQSQHIAPSSATGKYSKDQQGVIKDLFGQYDDLSKEIRALDQGHAFLENYDVDNATAADDISLIYAFNKVMDPRSVVREGEFTIASSVGGILDQLGADVEKVKGGGRLLPAQRQQIVDSMERTYKGKKNEYDPLLQNAIQAGAKRGIDDPTLYLDYLPEDYTNPDGTKVKTKPDPWAPISSGLQNLLGNNFNPPSDQENPWDVVDITTGDDILNEF